MTHEASARDGRLAIDYRAAQDNYSRRQDLTRFEAFTAREFRSAVVNRELRQVVHRAKYRRHGKAGVTWRGVPLLKDPWDMMLYPMLLWELRPATIVELGAFLGGSALWFADLASTFGLQTRILSFDLDIDRVQVDDPRIEFIAADLSQIASGLSLPVAELPHPWLVIEDAHIDLVTVLAYLDQFIENGDYMVVEDTLAEVKYREFEVFMRQHGSRYRVDTHYADNFGYNGTHNWNSVLKCTADQRP
jgi:cephalosporin hydroxylase